MIHTTCDHCFREFGYKPGAAVICPSCGLENIRAASLEAAVSRPVPETAELSRPGAARRKPRRKAS